MTNDPIAHPSHYAGDGTVECMDAMRSMLYQENGLSKIASYWWCATLKYVWRIPHKNGIQDIDKAIRCLQYMKEEMELDAYHQSSKEGR